MSFLTAPQFLLDSVSIERLCMISTAQHVNLAISDLHQIPPASGGNKGEGGDTMVLYIINNSDPDYQR